MQLPDGTAVALSPGGQNPLIKLVVEEFCPRFAPGGVVIYIGDTENKFEHMESVYFGSTRLLGSGDIVAHPASVNFVW